MNKSERTVTLDSFIMKKLKNNPIALSNTNPSVEAHTEITDVNFNQHAINSNVNEMTTSLFSPENNRDGLTNSTPSYEEGPSLSSVNFRCSSSEHVDNT